MSAVVPPLDKSNRRIVCAAIRDSAGHIICAPRHWDSIMRQQVSKSPDDWNRAEQGFVDQHGVFLRRDEAHGVAIAAGQIVRRVGGDENVLYSENLY